MPPRASPGGASWRCIGTRHCRRRRRRRRPVRRSPGPASRRCRSSRRGGFDLARADPTRLTRRSAGRNDRRRYPVHIVGAPVTDAARENNGGNRMRRVLLATAAVIALSAPALADDVKIEKQTITRESPTGTTVEKQTITREEPGEGSTVSTTIIAPKAPPALQVETPPPAPRPTEAWIPGHWRWEPGAANSALG